MARYFFHLLGSLRWEDEEGQDFPDLSGAYRSAVERLAAMDRGSLGGRRGALSIQVTSEEGAALFAVSLDRLALQHARPGRFGPH